MKKMTMQRRTAAFAMTVALDLALLSAMAYVQAPLPSWSDGKAKQATVVFVAQVTQEGAPDFVPPPNASPRSVFYWPVGQGARRSTGQRLDRRQHEGRLESHLSVRGQVSRS
jgi:hypothetical protein